MSAVIETTTHTDIELAKLTLDDRCQLRERLSGEVITEYCEAYKECSPFPEITCFFDGQAYWLADGFHRVHGAKLAGLTKLPAMIIPGTMRDAILFAASANASHGLRRSNGDKRKAARTFLLDGIWSRWSNHAIAKAAKVSVTLVSTMRHELADAKETPPVSKTRVFTRDGKIFQMRVDHLATRHNQPVDRSSSAKKEDATQYRPDDGLCDAINRTLANTHKAQRELISKWLRQAANKIDSGATEV